MMKPCLSVLTPSLWATVFAASTLAVVPRIAQAGQSLPSPPAEGSTNEPAAAPERQADPLAAAHMVGAEASGASLYFLTYGLTVSAMAGLYGNNGVVEAPGVALGLAVGGLVNLGIGGIVLAVGSRRLKATDAWLDAKPRRRARFTAKARRRRLYLDARPTGETTQSQATQSQATQAVVRRGGRLKLAGLGIVAAGGLLNGVAMGVTPLSLGAGIGLNLTGWSAVIVGAAVSARGKKMMFRPHEHGGTPRSMAVVPTMLGTPDGLRVPGLAASGRF